MKNASYFIAGTATVLTLTVYNIHYITSPVALALYLLSTLVIMVAAYKIGRNNQLKEDNQMLQDEITELKCKNLIRKERNLVEESQALKMQYIMCEEKLKESNNKIRKLKKSMNELLDSFNVFLLSTDKFNENAKQELEKGQKRSNLNKVSDLDCR
ncbi:hypothetical protein BIY23_03545 [Wolbachia pipientis]|uniref:Uncharacterized protein n=1 Tax=Wolbachia pipientis TaxID=955 RepID=A0A1E7QJR5_WOLPI|nr:hypothetical protein [Wolbachia pipientis]OEY86479.1 hypothetical protein BIY23_03545 [Wolbachia pipientis]